MAYSLLLWLHVVGATLLFGFGLGSAYYFHAAHRSGDPRIMAAIGGFVVKADWLFTGATGLAQPLTGYFLIRELGLSGRESWLLAVYGLYGLALACWLPVVAIQIRVTALAREAAAKGESLSPLHFRLMRLWVALGWPAFLALGSVFWLMLAKPDL